MSDVCRKRLRTTGSIREDPPFRTTPSLPTTCWFSSRHTGPCPPAPSSDSPERFTPRRLGVDGQDRLSDTGGPSPLPTTLRPSPGSQPSNPSFSVATNVLRQVGESHCPRIFLDFTVFYNLDLPWNLLWIKSGGTKGPLQSPHFTERVLVCHSVLVRTGRSSPRYNRGSVPPSPRPHLRGRTVQTLHPWSVLTGEGREPPLDPVRHSDVLSNGLRRRNRTTTTRGAIAVGT